MTREHFISDLSHWNSYLPMLWKALEETSGHVVELGIGEGSTVKLHEYCKAKGRTLNSYESDLQWYRRFEHLITGATLPFWHSISYVGDNWESMVEREVGGAANGFNIDVIFSDEAPGHMRKYNVSIFAQTAKVIVVHDAEPSNDHGYRFSWVRPLFKYYKLHEFPGASTAAFSNFIDVSKWEV